MAVDPAKSRLLAKHDALIDELLADPRYRVTAEGAIERMERGQWRSCTWIDDNRTRGTRYLSLRYGRVRLQAHRVVYRALVGELRADLVINHRDGDGRNNHPANLELVTQSENNLHAYRVLGRRPVPGNAKLTPAAVAEIRAAVARGVPQVLVAATFRVSNATVSEIVAGKIWRDVA